MAYEEVVALVDESGSEEAANSNPRRRRTIAVVLVGCVGVLVVAAFAHGSYGLSSKHTEDITNEYASSAIDKTQPAWAIVELERDRCSKPTENCATTGCCKTVGHKCYKTANGGGKCQKECKTGPCELFGRIVQNMQVEAPGVPAETMFCWAVYTQNTGSTKKSYEKELLTQQHAKNVSIFSCNAYAVYSDAEVDLGGGLRSIKVTDKEGDFHFAKRKETGAWVNTGMFKQIWAALRDAGTYKNYDWTVKADPDAVFLPGRLVNRIRMLPRPSQGIFLTNCKLVDNGFFGNLEVFSSLAFGILLANVENCNSAIDWKTGVKGGKYGPMGEDLFAEKCMEKHGVAKVEAFDISIDGACPADRPDNLRKYKKWHGNCEDVVSAAAIHPFKKPKDYFDCLEATTNAAAQVE